MEGGGWGVEGAGMGCVVGGNGVWRRKGLFVWECEGA